MEQPTHCPSCSTFEKPARGQQLGPQSHREWILWEYRITYLAAENVEEVIDYAAYVVTPTPTSVTDRGMIHVYTLIYTKAPEDPLPVVNTRVSGPSFKGRPFPAGF